MDEKPLACIGVPSTARKLTIEYECLFERRVDEACLVVFCGCLKDTPRYRLKATTPCAIAYDYARIRRLVRLGFGFYRSCVTEKQ
jgi:hypothetical protein